MITTAAPDRIGALPLMLRYLRPYTARVTLLALLLAGTIAAQLASPQFLRAFIDATQQPGAAAATLNAALAYILLAAIQRAAAIGGTYVSTDLGWRTTNRLRRDLTEHVLRLDMGFHKLHTPGELMTRVDGDCDGLRNFFAQFGIRVLSNGLLVLGIILLVAREDWRVGIGVMLYALAVFATLIGLQRIAVSHWSAYRAAIADTASFLEERMAGMEDIRSSGAERHNLAQLTDLTNQQLRQRRLAELLSNVIFASTNFLFLIGYALGLGIGAFLYTSGQASIGGAFLIVVYIGMIAEPLETIRNEAQELQQAAASIGRIAQLFAERSRLREQPSASLPSGPLSVSFDHVSFAYRDSSPPPEQELAQSDDDRVLREITLSLAPGQILGLLGRTGSGKSTTARLVARLYDPDQGRICVGGSDLRTLALSELRTRVGVVTQDVQIFQASIRDNLRLFQTHIPDAALETALRQLGLLDWVRNLPEGLDTRLGPGGMGLSAGEAQLLAFARVFLNNPGLVIMDEASSRLDPATERLLEQAITRLLAGRTAIIIAHRLTTIQRADQILILEQGSVSEQGARAVLAADPQSRFAALLRVGMQEVLA